MTRAKERPAVDIGLPDRNNMGISVLGVSSSNLGMLKILL